MIRCDAIYLLTAFGLTPGGSTHLHTNNTQNNTMKQNIQNGTYIIIIIIHKHNYKNTSQQLEYIIYKIKQKHIKHTTI